MWQWLMENHPVIYEVVQWSILGMAIIALVLRVLICLR